MATAETPTGEPRTQEAALDSYVLFRVTSDDFQRLRYEYRSEIYFYQAIDPDTFEVVALKTINLQRMACRAEIEMPYNPAAPAQELIDKHGLERAKVLMRKTFVDRWCREIHDKRVQAAYLCCMAQHHPEDFQWITSYAATRAFAVESKEMPLDLTEFKLIGVQGPISDTRIRAVLKERKADAGGVLSTVRVEGDLYELWVSAALVETFKSRFNVQMGFDPVFCAGVSEVSVAQERLLKRIKGLDFDVQQLYLYHLKTTRPEIHQWIIERLWQSPEKAAARKTFFVRGIGGELVEISLSSRRKVRPDVYPLTCAYNHKAAQRIGKGVRKEWYPRPSSAFARGERVPSRRRKLAAPRCEVVGVHLQWRNTEACSTPPTPAAAINLREANGGNVATDCFAGRRLPGTVCRAVFARHWAVPSKR
jgi:hypothetical protein